MPSFPVAFSFALGLLLGIILYWLSIRGRLAAFREMARSLSEAEEKASQGGSERDKAGARLVVVEETLRATESKLATVERDAVSVREALSAERQKVESLQAIIENREADLKALDERMKLEFQNLSNAILESQSQKFIEQNQERLSGLLMPLQERIQDFKKKVEETHGEATTNAAVLRDRIEQLTKLNNQVTQEAHNLADALRGESKTQGNWGEVKMEVLLEKSGLERDIHFLTQRKYKQPDGTVLQPDAVILLPENRCFIVDSKVSITAFQDYCAADGEEERAALLKAHIKSVQSHIEELAEKRYQNLDVYQAPEFVFMFVPQEAAFATAMKEMPSLYEEAAAKHVILTTTSTLLAALHLIKDIWDHDQQDKKVQEIIRRAGDLYEKFVGFAQDMLEVGAQLDKARDRHKDALKKLSVGKGNVVRRLEEMKKLGAKVNKSIPEALLRLSGNEEDGAEDLVHQDQKALPEGAGNDGPGETP